LQQELTAANVQTRIKPLLSVYPLDTWRLIEMLIALPLAVIMLTTYIRRHRINLLHCRSYHAGLLGLIVKKIMAVPYIFDPRSAWIGEQVLMGKLSKHSLSYHLWKKLEAAIVHNASVCIVVSDTLKDEYAPLARRVEVIYTTTSEKHFERIDEAQEQTLKEMHELESLGRSYKLLVFNAGNFNRWNNLDHLLTRYEELARIESDFALVIVTRTPREVICRAVSAHELDPNRILVISLDSNSVPLALRKCDYGLLVRPQSPESRGEISVKFGEYLAAGLPVFCDEYIGGAAHIIKQHNVGALLSNDWEKNKEILTTLQKAYPEVSRRCQEVARELFSVYVHADKYVALYREAVK
jgi:glycosyltransferase involved in cell wall biosynthesis